MSPSIFLLMRAASQPCTDYDGTSRPRSHFSSLIIYWNSLLFPKRISSNLKLKFQNFPPFSMTSDFWGNFLKALDRIADGVVARRTGKASHRLANR
jgi:hypothetical protein